MLFILVLEAITRRSNVKTKETGFKNKHQRLALAEVVAIIAKKENELKWIIRRIANEEGN